MTTHVITTSADRKSVLQLIENRPLPITVSIVKGKKRSVEQNRLQRLWMIEAAEQLDEYTAEEYRAFCKLHFGVPILRGEDEEFRKVYDDVIRPASYENKLKMMAVPIDLPVTSRMKTGQKKRYLDDVYHHFTGLGVKLTEPNEH